MIRVRAGPARNIKSAAEDNAAKRNLLVDKMGFGVIMIRNEKSVEEKSKLGKKLQRERPSGCEPLILEPSEDHL